jgi:hypothetical protein
MVDKFINALFGCWHSHYSFPITVRPGVRRNKAAALTGTYVVCLECGKEFPYSWEEMKVVDPNGKGASAMRSLAAKEAA